MRPRNLHLLTAFTCLSLLFVGCNKKVEPKKEESDPNLLHLSQEALSSVTLKTEVIARQNLLNESSFPGRVEMNPATSAVVAPFFEGRIAGLVAQLGDHVKKGDPLVKISSPQTLGEPVLLRSPVEGNVLERKGNVGERVDQNMDLFIISDLSVVMVAVAVDEKSSALIQMNQPATVKVPAYGDEFFKGKPLRIGGRIDPETHALDVIVEVPNPDHKLKPGMVADVGLVTGTVKETLAVPEDAVQSIGDLRMVFVQEKAATEKEPAEFRKVEIKLGRKLGNHFEVIDGLKEGVTVVTQGSLILKAELQKGSLSEE